MFTKSATYKRESFVIRFLKRSLHEEMPQLGEFNKDRMIGMLEASLSIIKVARKITCCKRTVEQLWKGSEKTVMRKESQAVGDQELLMQGKMSDLS